MILNVNASEVIQHTARLEKMGRADLPVVVRQTLNKAAYDVKTNTMLEKSNVFIHRKKEFFRANSKVVQAQGLDIKMMKATVGFVPKQGDRSHSVEDLAAQEHGGRIPNRSFVALAQARKSGRWDRLIREEAFMERIKNYIKDAKNEQGANDKVKFIKACVKAGLGGFVLSAKRNSKGARMLFLVQGFIRVGGNTHVKALPLFSVKKDRVVQPKATHFMADASIESAQKMQLYFNELAEARIALKSK